MTGKWAVRTYRSGNMTEKSKFWVPEQKRCRRKRSSSLNCRQKRPNDGVRFIRSREFDQNSVVGITPSENDFKTIARLIQHENRVRRHNGKTPITYKIIRG